MRELLRVTGSKASVVPQGWQSRGASGGQSHVREESWALPMAESRNSVPVEPRSNALVRVIKLLIGQAALWKERDTAPPDVPISTVAIVSAHVICHPLQHGKPLTRETELMSLRVRHIEAESGYADNDIDELDKGTVGV
jgi:hypothetical protein